MSTVGEKIYKKLSKSYMSISIKAQYFILIKMTSSSRRGAEGYIEKWANIRLFPEVGIVSNKGEVHVQKAGKNLQGGEKRAGQ